MKTYLKKLNSDIGDLEYMMYQEIPANENGAVNNLKGTTLIDYYILIKNRILFPPKNAYTNLYTFFTIF